MRTPRTEFPVWASAYELTPGDQTILMDGMEVVFDRTAGFYPVRVEPKPEPPPRAS